MASGLFVALALYLVLISLFLVVVLRTGNPFADDERAVAELRTKLSILLDVAQVVLFSGCHIGIAGLIIARFVRALPLVNAYCGFLYTWLGLGALCLFLSVAVASVFWLFGLPFAVMGVFSVANHFVGVCGMPPAFMGGGDAGIDITVAAVDAAPMEVVVDADTPDYDYRGVD